MPRTCTVCRHPSRTEIDGAIVGGQSYRDIARQHDLTKDSVGRHAHGHVSHALARAQHRERADGENLYGMWEGLRSRGHALLDAAESKGDLRAAASALRELRGLLDLPLKHAGDLRRQQHTVALLQHPEWTELRTVLVDALGSHPDARQSVIVAISNMERPP